MLFLQIYKKGVLFFVETMNYSGYHANSYYMSKRGLPKWGNPYGNRASVVVRARESLVHGEGKQPISFNVKFWKM